VLAAAAAATRVSQGAWIEAAGLSGLAFGLLALHLSAAKPFLKPFAWVAFGVTGLSIVVVLVRMQRG